MHACRASLPLAACPVYGVFAGVKTTSSSALGGEAVKAIDPDLLAREPDVPWVDVAGMRNHLAHRYFDTAHGIVQATITDDLPPLVAAVQRLHRYIAGDLPLEPPVTAPKATAMVPCRRSKPFEIRAAHVEVAAWRRQRRLRFRHQPQRLWCHWISEQEYRCIKDLVDYSAPSSASARTKGRSGGACGGFGA